MFNSIKGILSGKSTDSIYIETMGIEWEIFVSTLSLDAFGLVGEQTRIFTWLYHREDQMKLFGFPCESDRLLFLDLIKVDGVGPKQALKIMSGINSAELEKALDEGDIAKLQMAPGVGKKTAQKMVLALKGKLTNLAEINTRSRPEKHSEFEDIVIALTEMGFDRKAAIEKIEKISSEMKNAGKDPSKNEDELFKQAIISLS